MEEEITGDGQDGDPVSAEELAAAIEGGLLRLYFQPIVSLSDRSATMLEALPRWPDPARGILAPADFIEVAAENGLLEPLERWAIEEGFRQLAIWRSGIAAELSISLNLSETHVYEADLAAAIREAASRHSVTAHRLGFEISETALIEAGGRSIEKLRSLTDLGVSLTIDDYAGAVGIDLIRELPTNALKISRRIIAGIPDDDRRVEAAEAAIAIARELGLATIANGIEGPGQLASMRDMGCRYAQGFLISLPMPAEVLEERMMKR